MSGGLSKRAVKGEEDLKLEALKAGANGGIVADRPLKFAEEITGSSPSPGMMLPKKNELADMLKSKPAPQSAPAPQSRRSSSLQSGAMPDPNTFEVVDSQSDGVAFRDPQTGRVWTGMELRKLDGHQAKLNEGKIRQLQKMGK